MSLINQMLKDLEQRGAHSNEASKISLPAINSSIHNRNSFPWVKLSLLVILALAGYYAWHITAQKSAPKVDTGINLTLNHASPTPAQPNKPTEYVSEQSITNNNRPTASPANTVNTAASLSISNETASNMPAPALFAKTLQFNTPKYQAPAIKEAASKLSISQRDQSNTPLEIPQSTRAIEPTSANINNSQQPTTKQNKEVTKAANKATVEGGKQIRPEQKSSNQYRAAITQLQQGRVSEAEDSLKQALDANPANQEARQTLAGLLVDNKRIDEAKSILISGLAIHPEQIEFRMALARLQVEAGERSNALATLEQGLPDANNNADYQSFTATLLQRAERHDEAMRHYNTALSLNPNHSNALIGLGISAQATGKFDIASLAFTRAQTSATLSTELSAFVAQRLKQVNQKLARLQ